MQFNLTKDLASAIRLLSSSSVELAKSGHPGMPLGMADFFAVLVSYHLRFNPTDPKWFNRDRLVLSAGHGSMLLYSYLYLTGYKDINLDDIKNFRQLNAITSGHPEYELHEAIETTTGPLGQGIANSVGMAIAAKKYAAKLGDDIANHQIFTICGDGCLMEGISYEALSLAGHLKLDNLVVIFDSNNISIDGSTSLAVSENHALKMQALGFEVAEIDGHDHHNIAGALAAAREATKPAFIICNTEIGRGAKTKAGSNKAHGSPLGAAEHNHLMQQIYQEWQVHPQEQDAGFFIPNDKLKNFRSIWMRNQERYNKWQEAWDALDKKERNFACQNKLILPDAFNVHNKDNAEATRASCGKILAQLIDINDKLIIGSADLAESNNLISEKSKPITADDFSGNFIHYGVREHAMAGIMNGLAVSGFFPVGGSFLVFSDYMRPSIRLSCMMKLPMIYVMTHDSIGLGEDGPTHQPIEHLAALRAIPNLTVIRPADAKETLGAVDYACKNLTGPTLLALSRQKLIPLENSADQKVHLGGYILQEASAPDKVDVVIFASGSEVDIAKCVADTLNHRLSIRVISCPNVSLLTKAENKKYLASLVGNSKLKVAIEAGTSFGWHQIIGSDGLFFGVEEYGLSAPAKELFEHYNLTAKAISRQLHKLL